VKLRVIFKKIERSFEIFKLNFRVKLLRILKQKIVIFDVSEIDMLPFQVPIIEEVLALDRKDLSIFISAPDHLSLECFNFRYHRVSITILPEVSIKCVYVSSTIHAIGPKLAESIFMSHGYPVKFDAFPSKCLEYFKHFTILGNAYKDFIVENLIKSGIVIESKTFHNLGHVKLDITENLSDLNRSEILFAPSWDPELSLRTYGEELFQQLANIAEILDTRILVKLHPATTSSPISSNSDFFSGNIDWWKYIKSYFPEKFIDVSDEGLVDLIKRTRVLITDWSGVSLEYMYFEIPVIFLPIEADVVSKYTKIFGIQQSNQDILLQDEISSGGRTYGIEVVEISKLESAIELAWNLDLSENEKFTEFREKLFYDSLGMAKKTATLVQKLISTV
jgi:hypothetical protein